MAVKTSFQIRAIDSRMWATGTKEYDREQASDAHSVSLASHLVGLINL